MMSGRTFVLTTFILSVDDLDVFSLASQSGFNVIIQFIFSCNSSSGLRLFLVTSLPTLVVHYSRTQSCNVPSQLV